MSMLSTVKTALNSGSVIIVAADKSASGIVKVLAIYMDKDKKCYSKEVVSKEKTIKYIEGKIDFFTIDSETEELTPVSVVSRHREKYLRTDADEESEDNLGELPSVLLMETIIDLHIQ